MDTKGLPRTRRLYEKDDLEHRIDAIEDTDFLSGLRASRRRVYSCVVVVACLVVALVILGVCMVAVVL